MSGDSVNQPRSSVGGAESMDVCSDGTNYTLPTSTGESTRQLAAYCMSMAKDPTDIHEAKWPTGPPMRLGGPSERQQRKRTAPPSDSEETESDDNLMTRRGGTGPIGPTDPFDVMQRDLQRVKAKLKKERQMRRALREDVEGLKRVLFGDSDDDTPMQPPPPPA